MHSIGGRHVVFDTPCLQRPGRRARPDVREMEGTGMFVSTHSRHDHASGQVQYDASGFNQHPDGTNFIIAMEGIFPSHP